MGSSKRVTIGYRYFVGMHLVVCKGPVDEVQEIIAGKRIAWTGPITASQTIFINSPNLFGGDKKEGGIQGNVDLAFGENTQMKNTYLMNQLGANIPAFRGVLSLILNQCLVSSMTKYPKPWAVKVKRAAARSWYAARAEIPADVPNGIPGGSANGAHIIYEAMTDADWGLGLPITSLNDASFRAAADILYDENFGISLIFARQTQTEDFIQTILTHINGVAYISPTTGDFILKLIREPTAQEITDAIVLDETNIVELSSYERPSFAEMINEVVIQYRPQGALNDSSITVQDLASVQAQGGVVSQTFQYTGVDNANIAARVGQRELRQNSTPLAKLTLRVNREASGLLPGDIAKVTWPELGISNLVVRVFSTDYGDLLSGEIGLEVTEDIYSLPQTSYVVNQATNWVDPVGLPQASTAADLFELPYFEIATNFSEGDQNALTNTSAFLQAAVITPPSSSTNYQLFLSAAALPLTDYAFDIDGLYSPSALLNQDLPIATTATSQVVNIINFSGVLQTVEIGSYAYLNNEVVEVEALDTAANTMTIKRAILDSVPQNHLTGDRIYFIENNDAQGTEEYVADPVTSSGDNIFARFLTQTDIGVLLIADSLSRNIQFVGRQTKPFPPKVVTIEGVFYPTAREQLVTNDTDLAWRSSNRLLQITKPFGGFYSAASVNAPEANSRFVINLYGENNTLLRTEAVTGTAANVYSYTYTAANEQSDSSLTGRLNGSLRVEIYTIRTDGADDIESLRRYDHTFDRSGWGYQYGNYYGGGNF